MNTVPDFALRIRARFPEGLTGIFAIGGTRTAFILDQNRHTENPGHIEDFSGHAAYLQQRYCQFMQNFFELGGQNMIITALSFRSFHERGSDYAGLVAKEVLRLVNDGFQQFYRDQEIDPYFVGIDTLLHLPEGSPSHQTAQTLARFQANWNYRAGRRKVLWEVASIPLYSFWKLQRQMPEQEQIALDAEIDALTSMDEIHKLLYRRYSAYVYGTEVPMPHLYLGTNKSGDLKWRSPMPISLTGGEYMRLFYTPYPSLFTTQETMQTILHDLAFNERFHSLKTDYSGQYSPELVEAEYQRIIELSSRPETTVGFARRLSQNTEEKTDI